PPSSCPPARNPTHNDPTPAHDPGFAKPFESGGVCTERGTSMITLAQQTIGKISKKLDWLGPLLARIAVGVVFAKTGWGKLHGLDDVTQFFTELGLPAPHFQAILVGTTEFVGGLLV